MALCTTEVVSPLGFHVSDESIYGGMSRVQWHGRLEVVREKPTIILDGAHNPGGMRVLSEFFRTHHTEKKKILIFGVMKDKAYKKMLEEIIPLVDLIIITKPDMERALSPDVLKPLIPLSKLSQVNHSTVFYTQDVKSALERAKNVAGDNDLILITGSLYTIGEAKQIIHEIF
jgi:dihydrofolate synthase/folylpolyglutamate synthase